MSYVNLGGYAKDMGEFFGVPTVKPSVPTDWAFPSRMAMPRNSRAFPERGHIVVFSR
jgi:hypothetical protein